MKRFWARDRWQTLLLGLVMVGFGIYLVQDCSRAIYRQVVSKAWPTTFATLNSVRRHLIRRLGWYPDVEYTYAVNGAIYHGDAEDLPHLSYTELRRTMVQGERVAVHYNPQRPSISVLDPGFPLRRIWVLIVGVTLALFGLVATATNFEQMRKKLEKRLRRNLPRLPHEHN